MRGRNLGFADFPMNRRASVLRATLISALFFASPAMAQLMESPRGVGMSKAVRGDPVGNSALVYNPAGMSRAYQYAAQVQYFRGGPGELNSVGANVVDSKTQPALAVGLAYGYQFADSGAEGAITGHDGRMAFSHAISPNQFHMGVGLHYVQLDRDIEGVEDVSGFSMDAGLLWSITGALHIGIVGENLINLDDAAYPRRAGGGIGYSGSPLVLDVDVLADFDTDSKTTVAVHAGAELLIADSVPLRVGYSSEPRAEGERTQFVGGGVGFTSAAEGSVGNQLHVGFRQNLDDADHFVFSAGITLFL